MVLFLDTFLSYRVSLIFCFQGYADLRNLHSFPTRRSSDLEPVPHQDRVRSAAVRGHRGGGARRHRTARSALPVPASSPDADRSEEHTSELQSRFDLVCRLLLEKKKKTSVPRLLNSCCTLGC